MSARNQLVVVTMLAVIVGCGGGGGGRSSSGGDGQRTSGKADTSAMRALLARYSPTGSWIVNAADTLPRTFTIGGRTTTLSTTGQFERYFNDGSPRNLVRYMSTAVHEVFHAISTRLGYQLMVEAGTTELVDAQGIYLGGTPLLVRFSESFPAREIDPSFPPDARSHRYATYISPSGDNHGTQIDGVFGLMDEWTAYHHSARITLDFWPWIRDEAPRTRDVYVAYRSAMHSRWLAGKEFKLYILHYLVHAGQHRPDVYSELMSNQTFRRAFAAIDDAWSELAREREQLEPAIASIAAERGAASVIYPNDDAYSAVVRYLASEPYKSQLAALRR